MIPNSSSLRLTNRRTFLANAVTLGLGALPLCYLERAGASCLPPALDAQYSPIAEFTTAFCQLQRDRTLVDFVAIRQQGLTFLSNYLRQLQETPVASFNENEQLAYWLNIRNLLVIEALAQTGAYRNLEKHRGTGFDPGPLWVEKRFSITQNKLSIDDIERKIILTGWAKQPNILYGLYQGTRSGPRLLREGFNGANVLHQLEALGKEFVNSPSGIHARQSTAYLPAIYRWYSNSLFQDDQQALVNHVASLAQRTTARSLRTAATIKHRSFSYRSDRFSLRKQAAHVVDFDL